MRPRRLWAIKSPHGVIVLGDIGILRSSVIADFVRRKNNGCNFTRYGNDGVTWLEPNRYHSWKQLYRQGWRVVQVKVEEVRP